MSEPARAGTDAGDYAGHRVSRAAVVAAARSLLGVPIFHRGRDRAGGVDCLGLVMLAGIESGAIDDPTPLMGDLAEYRRLPDPVRLVAGLDRFMVRLALGPASCDMAGDGDVIALAWGERDRPMHLAILATYAGRRSIIHAYPRLPRGEQRVVEVTFGGDWPDRVCGAWRFPRLET